MGAESSIMPDEELRELTTQTSFKRKELKRWYRMFMKEYPDGRMEIGDFKKLYEKLYPNTATTETEVGHPEDQFSEHMFRSFDRQNKGFVTFKELMISFSTTSCGTRREKLEWSFNVFDVERNGRIAMEDVHQLVRSVRSSAGESDQMTSMNDLDVSELFVKIDADGDGYWSLEEFIAGTRNYPSFFKKTLKVRKKSRSSE